ncbi:DMT family transporter [Szabonella alba]|uniref:EamA family transporter n=1 Tax=Szabonella alba TaxID=2804194 RepID=A0A8K0V9V6_9RHOB|nr:EamA family transporter [Szabonella alba]MBL4916318.1 EamA family transporter [Szabonella alba]
MARQDWFWITALSVLWGGSFFFVEIALTGLSVTAVVWLRVALAALILGAVLLLRGGNFPARAHWPGLLVMGLLNNALPFCLIALAQEQITSALASILNATTPLFTLIVAHLATTDERITPRKAAGLGLGFAGVVVMMAGESLTGAGAAKIAVLMAAFCYALASVWGRRFRAAGLAPLGVAFGQVTASTALLLPVMLVLNRPWEATLPPVGVLLAVLGLAVFSTALAYLIFFRLLASAGATRLSLVTFLIPVSATALGVLLLGEVLLPRHVAGFALIAAGLAAISGGKRPVAAAVLPR